MLSMWCSVDGPDLVFGNVRIRDKIYESYFTMKNIQKHVLKNWLIMRLKNKNQSVQMPHSE